MYLRNPIQPIRRTRPSRRARIWRIRRRRRFRPLVDPPHRHVRAVRGAGDGDQLHLVPDPADPAFSFLKYDPSGIVCLIAGFAYGPAAAAIVSVLGFVPHVFMDRGHADGRAGGLSLSVPAALIYRHVHTRKGAVIGLVVGALLALVAAIAGNLVITPIYTGWPVSEVAAIIVPALLPFNLIKFVIHGVVTFLVYKPISNLLNR